MFSRPITNYNLKNTQKVFENFKGFWFSIRDWKKNVKNWKNIDFNILNGEEVESEVSN